MTTYTFKDITLEHDREWRAWRRLEWPRDLPFNASDEWRSGPNKWEPLGPVTNMGNVFDYRRPVPLPSIDPELAEVASIPEGVFKIAPSHQDVCDWLRDILPGYEEQLAKASVNAVSMMFRWADGERPTEQQPSPVPADGWRPWHHSVKYVTRVKKMPVDRWVDRDEFDTEEEARADLAFVAPLLPSLKCHIVRREVTEHVLEPLPPPPQEKGGEA